MKKCSKCGEIKLETEFYKDRRTKSGLYSACKDCHKKHYEDNSEKFKEYRKKYRENNLEKFKERKKRNYRKLSKNPFYRINKIIRNSIGRSIKGNKKNKHWESLVGYTKEELMEHLEKQFESWMTWENWGAYEEGKLKWQIDHIRPISSFNFTFPEDKEFRECWALENLQPLEAMENNIKGNKY